MTADVYHKFSTYKVELDGWELEQDNDGHLILHSEKKFAFLKKLAKNMPEFSVLLHF